MNASRPRILVTRRLFAGQLDALRQHADVIENPEDVIWSPAELRQRAQAADAIIATLTEKFDADLIVACPRLKLIANVAVGYNNIDIAACQARGIVVSNTPDVLTESTADHAWALLLATARRVTESERYLRSGQWEGGKPWALDMLLGADVHHKTLGILGMGRIGAAIARRATGFAMQVQYHNRQPLSDSQINAFAIGSTVRYVSCQTLIETSDFLVLVLPYSAETHHTIGVNELRQMQQSAILINIARGGIVDDAALINALRTGQIAGAGLDVFEGEPAFKRGFLDLNNVVLTPHIGSATHDTRFAMAALAIANVQDWLQGHRPRTQVN